MIKNRDELIEKLYSLATLPDDFTIKYKTLIHDTLLKCPELLYALNNKELESELFNEDGSLKEDGEWDRYFGENGSVRPYILIPETNTDTRNYVCYQVGFDDVPTYHKPYCYTQITFTIFVNENNRTDPETGIPRHDLIASIIKGKFNWSSIFGLQTKLISSKESTTDTHFLVRTLIFQIYDLNSISQTPYGEDTRVINNEYWS